LGVVVDDAPDGAELAKKSVQLLLGVKANIAYNPLATASAMGCYHPAQG
jgi:hypothetical protein